MTDAEAPNDALLDALDRLRDTGLEFGGFLANHGPMAAEALVHVGAGAAAPGWVDAYRTRLGPAPEAADAISDDEWREHLGDDRRAGDWTALLRRQAREVPWRDLLLRWWPRLLPGFAASAAHGVIRTAHAVRSLRAAGPDPHPLLVDELAQGLALWAWRFQYVVGRPGLTGDLDAVPAVAEVPRLDPDTPSEGPGISGRLRALGTLGGFPAALDRWGAPTDPDLALDALIGASARVLAARDDAPIAFCHAVTAPAAVRMVLPELPPDLARTSVATSWLTVGAIVAAFASPRTAAESAPVESAPTPDEVMARGIEHGDEHAIKLAEAARREFVRTADPTLLVAADRFRQRLDA